MQVLAFSKCIRAEPGALQHRLSVIDRLVPLPSPASVFGPSGLRRASEDPAAFFRTDIPPSRRTQTDGDALNGRWRQFTARQVEHLDREIQQRLWWETGLAHDAAQSRGPARTKHARDFRIQNVDDGVACCCACHACACRSKGV